MTELLLKEEVYKLIGAAMEVHTILGCGFHEAVYQEALEIELGLRNIPFTPKVPLQIQYKDRTLTKKYEPDLLVFEQIIGELKALDALSGKEESQVINYLKASGKPVGVLINFVAARLEWKRLANTEQKKTSTNDTNNCE